VGLVGYVLFFCLATDAFVGVDRKHHLQRLSVPFAGILAALLAFTAEIVSEYRERFPRSSRPVDGAPRRTTD